MYKFTRHFLFIQNNDQIIVGNKYMCTYLKISKECYDILEQLIQNGIDIHRYSQVFEESEDLEYSQKLTELLLQKRILVETQDEESIRSYSIQWELTNECNLSCRHCIADACTVRQSSDENKLIYDIADSIISLTPESLTITGGEPMVLSCFFELSAYIKGQYENELMLMTNGTLITAENAKQIASIFDKIFISIDGVDEETCRTIRGAGVFGKVVNAIRYLKEAGMKKISLSMVLTNENRVYKDKFYELCSKWGVTPMLRSFAPVGRGKNYQDWYVSSEKRFISNDSVDGNLVDEKRSSQPDVKFGSCGGRYGSVTIAPTGDIFLCAPYEYMNQSVGNITKIENVRDFFWMEKYKETKVYREFELKMPEYLEKCKDCNVRYFCWHCPFLFEQTVKNDRNFDLYCRHKKENLTFALWGEV